MYVKLTDGPLSQKSIKLSDLKKRLFRDENKKDRIISDEIVLTTMTGIDLV